MDRDFDILLWGVTGWTGIHLAEYFAENYPPGSSDISWAMCARSKVKLGKVVEQLKVSGFDWIEDIECIDVNNLDEPRVAEVVARAKCVATVVGPYDKYGESVVRACVEQGTHYCDITGETTFIRRMISRYHEDAVANGVFIVPCCGFDSIPSDIGVRTMVNFMNDELRQVPKSIRGYHCDTRSNTRRGKDGATGGGGTVATMLMMMSAPLEAFSDPYYLTGPGDKSNADHRHIPQLLVGFEKKLRRYRYTTMFPMSIVNEKIVRRTNYLLNNAYGPNFSYQEAAGKTSFLSAFLQSAVIIVGALLALIPFVRTQIEKRAPQPSSWPLPKAADYKPGRYEFRFVGETEKGVTCVGRVVGYDEPGWTETSKMLGESAITLIRSLNDVKAESNLQGGIVTPGILGTPLTLRLRAKNMKITAEKYASKRRSGR